MPSLNCLVLRQVPASLWPRKNKKKCEIKFSRLLLIVKISQSPVNHSQSLVNHRIPNSVTTKIPTARPNPYLKPLCYKTRTWSPWWIRRLRSCRLLNVSSLRTIAFAIKGLIRICWWDLLLLRTLKCPPKIQYAERGSIVTRRCRCLSYLRIWKFLKNSE